MGRIAVAAIVSFWVIPISILVNRVVPEPYMVIMETPFLLIFVQKSSCFND